MAEYVYTGTISKIHVGHCSAEGVWAQITFLIYLHDALVAQHQIATVVP